VFGNIPVSCVSEENVAEITERRLKLENTKNVVSDLLLA